MQGGSVAELLTHLEINPLKRAYSLQDAATWCLQITSALEYLHTLPLPIIHRDLKLDNILLCEVDGVLEAKLVDFGLSAVRARASQHPPTTSAAQQRVSGSVREKVWQLG
jgi:serine/threonine protein kinase